MISYPTKLASTSKWWYIGLKDTSVHVVVKTEPANWLARILQRLVKVRVIVDATETEGVALVEIFDRVLSEDEIHEMYQREREHFV